MYVLQQPRGTGSEADQWGVISHDERNEKSDLAVGTNYSLFFLLSTRVDENCPSKFTAYQGFDALFHATECYISKGANMMSDMYALTAIENIILPCTRSKDGNDIEAREHVAFANTLSGIVMTICSTTAEHSIEHAMSAFHHELPHGAGLIMISKAFYEFFIEHHACDERFIKMAQVMGIPNANKPEDFYYSPCKFTEGMRCRAIKMSEYGFTPDEFEAIAANAKETMGGLFLANPCELPHEGCVEILRKSYQ